MSRKTFLLGLSTLSCILQLPREISYHMTVAVKRSQISLKIPGKKKICEKVLGTNMYETFDENIANALNLTPKYVLKTCFDMYFMFLSQM